MEQAAVLSKYKWIHSPDYTNYLWYISNTIGFNMTKWFPKCWNTFEMWRMNLDVCEIRLPDGSNRKTALVLMVIDIIIRMSVLGFPSGRSHAPGRSWAWIYSHPWPAVQKRVIGHAFLVGRMDIIFSFRATLWVFESSCMWNMVGSKFVCSDDVASAAVWKDMVADFTCL